MTTYDVMTSMMRQLSRLQVEVDRLKTQVVHAPLNAGKGKQLIIDTGAVEATRPYIHLFPESGTADDLNTISNGSEGKMILLALGEAGDTITVNHHTVASGNLDLGNETSFDLDDEHQAALFIYRESTAHWELIARPGAAAVAAFLDLTDTPAAYTGAAGQAVAVNATEDALEFVGFPAAPVDSVNGQTGAVVLDADDIDETASRIWFTTAEETKLAGIETAADVTDAANMAAAIIAQDGKTTPVDTDIFPGLDSADSYQIKEFSWLDIKAALKAYFDTLYATVSGWIKADGTVPLTANWDVGEDRRILAEAFQARDNEGLAFATDDGITRLQIRGDGKVHFSAATNYTVTEIPVELGSVSRFQTIQIDIKVASAARLFVTHVEISLERLESTTAWGYATGDIVWQHPTSSGGMGIIKGSDLKSDSSGTTTVSVAAITDGIRFTFGGGDFTNTLNANVAYVRIVGWAGQAVGVTATIV